MRALPLLVLGCLFAASSSASDVRVPIQLDFAFMRDLLVQRAFTDPEQTARVFSDGVSCNQVTLPRAEPGTNDACIGHAGGVEYLARASYGAYKGGPGQLGRDWRERTPKSLRTIDASLFRRHEAVRDGRELEVARYFS